MLCPECNHPLRSITLKTHIKPIAIDYCNVCAGIWVEHDAINFLTEEDLAPLLTVLPKNPQHPTIYTNLCPKDRETLQIFRGENVPQNQTLFNCPKCRGWWFPDKQLFEFKKAQNAKLNYFKTWNIPLSSIYAVILPIAVFVLLGAGLFASTYLVGKPSDVRTRARDVISKPLILHPTPEQIVISFTTEKATYSKIRYWLNPAETTQVYVSSTPKTSHTIILRGLQQNREYLYQLIIEQPETVESPIYTFSTEE